MKISSCYCCNLRNYEQSSIKKSNKANKIEKAAVFVFSRLVLYKESLMTDKRYLFGVIGCQALTVFNVAAIVVGTVALGILIPATSLCALLLVGISLTALSILWGLTMKVLVAEGCSIRKEKVIHTKHHSFEFYKEKLVTKKICLIAESVQVNSVRTTDYCKQIESTHPIIYSKVACAEDILIQAQKACSIGARIKLLIIDGHGCEDGIELGDTSNTWIKFNSDLTMQKIGNLLEKDASIFLLSCKAAGPSAYGNIASKISRWCPNQYVFAAKTVVCQNDIQLHSVEPLNISLVRDKQNIKVVYKNGLVVG